MIINLKNNKLKIIFTHIQKSGGSSIIDFFNVKKSHNKIEKDILILNEKEIKLNSVFKFTVIRNPWDRMVSFFHYHKQKLKIQAWKYIKDLNFTQFIKSKHFEFWAKRNNITNYIKHNNISRIDYYIDFNNLKKDFELIKLITNIKRNLTHVNKSKHEEYKKYYRNENNKHIISSLFKDEIDFFNFKFGKPTDLKTLNTKNLTNKFLKK